MISLRSILRRRTTALALAAGLAAAGVATAAPASAYGPPANATVCFVFPDGSPYTGPVYAQAMNYGWRAVGQAQSMNGCTNWTIASGGPWRFQAYLVAYRTVFEGTSNAQTIYSPGAYNFGTWAVTASYY
jgi:ABC-type sugar transport system substrate-binding protein